MGECVFVMHTDEIDLYHGSHYSLGFSFVFIFPHPSIRIIRSILHDNHVPEQGPNVQFRHLDNSINSDDAWDKQKKTDNNDIHQPAVSV